ncbi:MAG TPA: S41 family peptidase [Pyrinomonadaceae bacterium]|nr:S41 family peptidase [Pyrinomonadaceae bacterium]
MALQNRAKHLSVLMWLFILVSPVSAQVSKGDREKGHKMLTDIVQMIRKHYYDPDFHGLDLDALSKEANEKINQAPTLAGIFAAIADLLRNLNDSHTFFLPPQPVTYHHQWEMQSIGDKCYVVSIEPGSEAEIKGLKLGDQVVALNGVKVTRESLSLIDYFYSALNPQPGFDLDLISPEGTRRTLRIMAKENKQPPIGWNSGIAFRNAVSEYEKARRQYLLRTIKLNDKSILWPLTQFDLTAEEIDDTMSKIRNFDNLVLDLRDNTGGLEENVLRLIGHFFDHNVKVGDLKRRHETRPLVAQSHGFFRGKLVVLVGSWSSSASELFARVMQLEGRAVVLGDRTPGRVMRSRQHPVRMDTKRNIAIAYVLSITDADIVMKDGKSLEGVGVTPDELLLPSPKDLAGKLDPVLQRAAALVGKQLTAAEAYKLRYKD